MNSKGCGVRGETGDRYVELSNFHWSKASALPPLKARKLVNDIDIEWFAICVSEMLIHQQNFRGNKSFNSINKIKTTIIKQ